MAESETLAGFRGQGATRGRLIKRMTQKQYREEGAEGLGVCRMVKGCAVGSGWAHRALRSPNMLTALPESFGQLAALEGLSLSRASAYAECLCVCGLLTIEQGQQ